MYWRRQLCTYAPSVLIAILNKCPPTNTMEPRIIPIMPWLITMPIRRLITMAMTPVAIPMPNRRM